MAVFLSPRTPSLNFILYNQPLAPAAPAKPLWHGSCDVLSQEAKNSFVILAGHYSKAQRLIRWEKAANRSLEVGKIGSASLPRGDTMKSSMKDKAEGTFHEVKGTVKEAVGKITDNPKLEVKGKAEKMAGKAQEKLGQVKKVFGK